MASTSASISAAKPVLQYAQELVDTGNYAILSFDALDAFYREDPDSDFTLTAELVERCSFIAKGAFALKDAAQFKAQVEAPKGISQGRIGNDKRAGILEQIKLHKFLKLEQFLTDSGRIFASNDLLEELTPSADKPCLTLQLLSKCVFVSKRIFDPALQSKKYQCDFNDGHENIVKFGKISSGIRCLQQIRDKNQKASQDEDHKAAEEEDAETDGAPIDFLYIFALKA